MKIKLEKFCWHCFKELGQTKENYDLLTKELKGDTHILVDINDDNLYQYTCNKGHTTYTTFQEEKFEFLFDFGALALIDGYTKEAVSTFASAFERFIEFYIKVISLNNSISQEEFLKTWKPISKQSERQLGAFYLLQLLEFKSTKFVINDNMTTFRNKVIHQGYIPKVEEAIEYGDYLLKNIFSLLIDLHSKCLEGFKKAQIFKIKRDGIRFNENTSMFNGSIPTIISLRSINSPDFGKITFSEAIKSVKNNSFYKQFYIKEI